MFWKKKRLRKKLLNFYTNGCENMYLVPLIKPEEFPSSINHTTDDIYTDRGQKNKKKSSSSSSSQ